MPSFAQTLIIGHLGGDPEVRHSNNGTPIANFSVAVSEKWNDKNTGEAREETEWYRCVVFGPSAEQYVAKYLHKGDVCRVRGKMKTREWKDSDGVDRKSVELVADRLDGVQKLWEKKKNAGSNPSGGQPYTWGRGRGQEALRDSRSSKNHGPPKDFDDDLPF